MDWGPKPNTVFLGNSQLYKSIASNFSMNVAADYIFATFKFKFFNY